MRPAHPTRSAPRWVAAALTAGLWLAGCTGLGPGAPSAPRVLTSAQAAFEQRYIDQAERHAAAGEWAEAIWCGEVLTALRPDVARHAEQLAQARRQRDAQASELARSARLAQQRGALEEATQRYLSLLALRPDDGPAADALRAIERERVRQEHLGRQGPRAAPPRGVSPRKPGLSSAP